MTVCSSEGVIHDRGLSHRCGQEASDKQSDQSGLHLCPPYVVVGGMFAARETQSGETEGRKAWFLVTTDTAQTNFAPIDPIAH